MEVFKKIVLFSVAIAISLAIGYMIPDVLSVQSYGIVVDEEILQENFVEDIETIYDARITASLNEEWNKEIRKYSNELQEYVNSMNGIETIDEGAVSTSEGDNESEKETADPRWDFTLLYNVPYGTFEQTVTIKMVKDSWIEQMYYEEKDAQKNNTENKLDPWYIIELVEGGYTKEESIELYDYLQRRLREEEIGLFYDYFYRYMGMLN